MFRWTSSALNLTRPAMLVAILAAAPNLVGQKEVECSPCKVAGYPVRTDVNGDRSVDLSDAVYLLTWLFLGGPPPDCPPGSEGAPNEFAADDPADCCVSCGDANGDAEIDLSDPVHLLNWLFLGGSDPECLRRGSPETCADATLVVDGEWVEANLDDETVQLVDVRSSSGYAASRIPGAVRVDAASVRATVDGVSGQVAPLDVVEDVFRAAGLRRDAIVVVYGSATDTTSARVLWTLQYYGHADVRLLDGGWGAWVADGRPVETGSPEASPSAYTIEGALEELRVTADWVVARLEDPTVALVDARSSGEYAGGHIPGALSVDWQRNVSQGALRPLAEVAALYEGIDRAATVVTYCQTGSRASVAYLALRWVGFSDVRVYDGSWAEWGSRGDLPRETE